MLNGLYIEAYSQNYFYQLFSHNSFTFGLIDNLNNGQPPTLIGALYFHDDTNANTGFIGSGYSQAGVAGIVIYGLAIGGYGYIADGLAAKHGLPVVMACLLMPMNTMTTTSDFPGTLLTHGALLSMIIIFISRADRKTPFWISVKK
ncbi:hypothetical protein LBMAG53_15010 [Planctomycetota bacterium]|nr:hypothetical protein LBMAG53_15010 [Planctomycetota bacterium]